jgi:hypothetical protein
VRRQGWNLRRDANEPAIVHALRQAGAEVMRLHPFDMLVLYHGQLFMLDAKMPKGGTTAAQDALVEAGWPLCYVRDPIDALRAIGAVR